MTSTPIIQRGYEVTIAFRLYDADTDGLIEAHSAEAPVVYRHGEGSIMANMEQALEGRAAGERFELVLEVEEAFGVRVDTPLQSLPRTAFPEELTLQPGMRLESAMPNGSRIPMWIAKLDGDTVEVDLNHPLSGHRLRFDIEVLDVDPSEVD